MPFVIREILSKDEMATLPTLASKIIRTINASDAATARIAKVMSSEKDISDAILELANSHYYDFNKNITTIDQAAMVLGFNTLQNLVIITSILKKFKQIPLEIPPNQLKYLWKHSLATGVTAEVIARENGYTQPEDFFTAGFLHDIGKIALYMYGYNYYIKIKEEAYSTHTPFLECESKYLKGEPHARIGAALVKQWKLSENIIYAVKNHHTPEKEHFSATVHCADIISRSLLHGSGGDTVIPLIDDRAWEFCRLHQKDLPSLFRKVENKIDAASFLLH